MAFYHAINGSGDGGDTPTPTPTPVEFTFNLVGGSNASESIWVNTSITTPLDGYYKKVSSSGDSVSTNLTGEYKYFAASSEISAQFTHTSAGSKGTLVIGYSSTGE